jgi:thiol-disulfide isomerase/thioredoxin
MNVIYETNMESVTNFLSEYRNPIYIAVGVLVIILVIWYMSRPRYMWAPYRMHPHRMEHFDDTQAPTTAEEPTKIIIFFAKWCPHCRRLMDGHDSVWEQFKRRLSQKPGVTVEQVEGDENPELATKYQIKSFPTILKLKKGKIVEFDGNQERTVDNLEKFTDA